MANTIVGIVLLIVVGIVLLARVTNRITDKIIKPLADISTIGAFFLAVYMLFFNSGSDSTEITLSTTPTVYAPIPSDTPTATGTSEIPSLTPTSTLLPGTGQPPFFEDDFNGNAFNEQLWKIVNAGLFVEDGKLKAEYKNESSSFASQYIDATLNKKQFKRAEFFVKLTDGTSNGRLRLATSCNNVDSRIFFDISYSEGVLAIYSSPSAPENFLPWGSVYSQNRDYAVRLLQDGDVVRVFVNEIEMSEPFPCKSMGEFLWLGAIASPQNFVNGYFDYIRLYTE